MELIDETDPRPVLSRATAFRGHVWDVVTEVVDLGAAGTVTRDFIDHPGAAAVVALDEHQRVVLVQQYRHPVGRLEWEIPAGLTDVEGEAPLSTAQRELAEEADLYASRWHRLLDVATTPGSSSETIAIFLARDLRPVPASELHERDGEELGMPRAFVPLDEVREAVLSGGLQNMTLAVAVLATCAARDAGWDSLSPA
ncbi:MAG: NUDIX hydrolase [Intrasporangiaceae bacterium]|nr:NUDIX hydrolase [Intrasporangiaceae bacterium]